MLAPYFSQAMLGAGFIFSLIYMGGKHGFPDLRRKHGLRNPKKMHFTLRTNAVCGVILESGRKVLVEEQ